VSVVFKKIINCAVIVSLLINIFAVTVLAAPSNTDVGIYDAVTVANIMDTTSVFELKAKASILMDATSGSVLLDSKMNDTLPLASITKIMTMLLVMEAIDSGKMTFEDIVSVSEHSAGMGGSQVYLKVGEQFSVTEMLKAVAIHSANDASVALAEKVAGSEEAFVSMMNEKAKELGMDNTNFLDCTGLTDEGHYSSAYDIAVMSRELITKHPKILEFTTIWHDTFRDGKFSLDNTNKLIRFYEGATGLKTGFTSKAGFCLSATAKKNGMHLIAVVLGEADSNTRFAEARKLLDYGFANYEVTKVSEKGEEIQLVPVRKGLKPSVIGLLATDVEVFTKKGAKDSIDKEVRTESIVTAPIKAGQKIGEVVYKVEGKEAVKADVVAASDVEMATFTKLYIRLTLEWFGIGR
jgi:D-alanyl-D-alanine carboxypeptidase (penicillin-binding protein 5/6)